eukprot:scaffold107958_cov42-Prasinocladus_malaysianus.AAC.2
MGHLCASCESRRVLCGPGLRTPGPAGQPSRACSGLLLFQLSSVLVRCWGVARDGALLALVASSRAPGRLGRDRGRPPAWPELMPAPSCIDIRTRKELSGQEIHLQLMSKMINIT